MSYNHLNRSSSILALAMVVTFRIPQITHHSKVVFRTVHSAFYFPHSAFYRHPSRPLFLCMLCTTNPLFDLNVVTAPSVQAFESRLDKAWKVQLLKFNYKEDSSSWFGQRGNSIVSPEFRRWWWWWWWMYSLKMKRIAILDQYSNSCRNRSFSPDIVSLYTSTSNN